MLVKIALGDRLEEVDVPEQEVIRFPKGVVGFEEHTGFLLFELEAPLYLLQSAEDPYAGFVVMDPFLVAPSYRVPAQEECSSLELEDDDRRSVLCIVTLSPEGAPISVNLRAPLVFNLSKRLGMQLILTDDLNVRHPLSLSPDGSVVTGRHAPARRARRSNGTAATAGRR